MDGFDLDGPKNRILETIFSFTYVSQGGQNNFKVDFKNCIHLATIWWDIDREIFWSEKYVNADSENISPHDCSV